MNSIKYTLIADGSSDKILMQIINWILNDLYPEIVSEGIFADFRKAKMPPKTIKDKIIFAQKFYPFDVLFYHRDAEDTNVNILQTRINEIERELSADILEKTICVVPIKMMETWLLIDENAIKKAAGNRNYKEKITLPSIKQLEKEKEPKMFLHNLLKQISGNKKFNVHQAVHLVAENIEDFSILRNLQAFQVFENEVKNVMNNILSK